MNQHRHDTNRCSGPKRGWGTKKNAIVKESYSASKIEVYNWDPYLTLTNDCVVKHIVDNAPQSKIENCLGQVLQFCQRR